MKSRSPKRKIVITIECLDTSLLGENVKLDITREIGYSDWRSDRIQVQVNRHQLPNNWKPYFKKNVLSVTAGLVNPTPGVVNIPEVTVITACLTPKEDYLKHFNVTTSVIDE